MTIKHLDWEGTIGQRIRIYRNLNNGTMSVQTHTKGVGWRVAGNVTNAIVAGVTFKVSEASRQRVIREGCKNVHAWGEGVLLAEFDRSVAAPIDLEYNPYVHATFVERHSERPIAACKFLTVRDNQVFVSADALPVTAPRRQNAHIFSLPDLSLRQFAAA